MEIIGINKSFALQQAPTPYAQRRRLYQQARFTWLWLTLLSFSLVCPRTLDYYCTVDCMPSKMQRVPSLYVCSTGRCRYSSSRIRTAAVVERCRLAPLFMNHLYWSMNHTRRDSTLHTQGISQRRRWGAVACFQTMESPLPRSLQRPRAVQCAEGGVDERERSL